MEIPVGKLLLLLSWPLVIMAQEIPVVLVLQRLAFLPPAVDGAGKLAIFGSSVTPDGTLSGATNIYASGADGTGLRQLTHFSPSQGNPATFVNTGPTAISLSASGAKAAYVFSGSFGGGPEEIHVIDIATGQDNTAAIYTQGCIQPLCAGCFFSCVRNPHLTSDGAKILYQVAATPSFFVVNSDGTGLTRLPVYSGSLAVPSQRVIGNNGLVVFTSNAPSGPTGNFAAAAQDVYVMNLDGTNIRAVTHFGNDGSIYSGNATISADGSTVAFETNYRGSAASQIWVAGSDGTNLRQLTFGSTPASQPSLSADGTLITLIQNGQVQAMRTVGLGPVRLLANFQMSSVQDQALSDDGSRLVIDIGPQSGGVGAIYSVGSDGSKLAPVYAPRALNPAGLSGVSPGGVISAYGLNFAGDALVTAPGLPLPRSLAGVSLLINGTAAPLLALTPWQVNAQVPPDTPVGTTSFQLQFADGTRSPQTDVETETLTPEIFNYQVTAGGKGVVAVYWQAAVLHAGAGIIVDDAHPAAAGEPIEIYGTGLGVTNPLVPAGTAAPLPPAETTAAPQVLIGSKHAAVLFSGLTPGTVGLYQVNVIVPSGLAAGRVPVVWQVGSVSSQSPGTIAVR